MRRCLAAGGGGANDCCARHPPSPLCRVPGARKQSTYCAHAHGGHRMSHNTATNNTAVQQEPMHINKQRPLSRACKGCKSTKQGAAETSTHKSRQGRQTDHKTVNQPLCTHTPTSGRHSHQGAPLLLLLLLSLLLQPWAWSAQTQICPGPVGACAAEKEMPHTTRRRLLPNPPGASHPPKQTRHKASALFTQLPPLSAL
jgi:hypothetical protein